jgi:hypothetical protein
MYRDDDRERISQQPLVDKDVLAAKRSVDAQMGFLTFQAKSDVSSIEALSVLVAKIFSLKLNPKDYFLSGIALDFNVQTSPLLIVACLKGNSLTTLVGDDQLIVVYLRVHLLRSRLGGHF